MATYCITSWVLGTSPGTSFASPICIRSRKLLNTCSWFRAEVQLQNTWVKLQCTYTFRSTVTCDKIHLLHFECGPPDDLFRLWHCPHPALISCLALGCLKLSSQHCFTVLKNGELWGTWGSTKLLLIYSGRFLMEKMQSVKVVHCNPFSPLK
jgi:hypothetical protein